MADMVTKQELANAKIDAKDLGDAVNEKKTVTPRYGTPFKTVPLVIEELNTKANEVIAQGFYKGFATETLLLAAKPTVSEIRARADDTRKIWRWNRTSAEGVVPVSGTWIDTGLSELDLAKNYTVTELAKVTATVASKNLYNPAEKQINRLIESTPNTGKIRVGANWGVTGFIAVTESQYYTIKANALKRGGLAFYTDNTGSDVSYIAGSYITGDLLANTPLTVQAPVGAKFMVVSLYSDTMPEPSQVMIEQGQTASIYEPYAPPTLIVKDSVLPDTVVKQAQLPALIAKPYEKTLPSKNLFNLATVKDGKYLDSTTGEVRVLAGWGISDAMPVTAGQYYTVSGTRGRAGLAFYTDAVTTTAITGSYNGSLSVPLTVQAPVGATYMRIALYSASVPTYTNVQVENGTSATSYEPIVGLVTLVDSAKIYYPPTAEISNYLRIVGSKITVKSMLNGLPVEMSALLTKPASHVSSTVFNFSEDKFNNVIQRTMTDDVAPVRAMGVTIGANHGYNMTLLTLTAHGKTNADVGSVWSDGTKQWVIVDIVSTSQLNITARADNTGFVSGTLTHVSGAANTSSFTPTAAATTQWYQLFKNRKLTCAVDGKPVAIADGTTEYRNNVTFNESYDIMAKNDIVEWLIGHGGIAVMEYDAEASLSLSMTYCFDIDGGCVVTSDLLALKDIAVFADFMQIQAVLLNAGNGLVEYIVPKSKPFTQDSVAYDFKYPTDIVAKNPINNIDFNAAKNADGATPVDRLLQRNSQVVFNVGFLPVLDAEPTKRLINASNKYLQIRYGTLKVYPALIDGLKTSLVAGDYFSGVAYRKYAQRTTDRTSSIAVRSKLGDFLIVDWQTARTDSVPLPADFAGRSFTVFEKSANVDVLSKTATNRIVFKVNTSVPSFAVLKFN